ncbi:MAG: OmpA family protein [Deltaproteobacteria bacterium]|nr:OmpA family protein [Deltaproteobacteria bacterium]
MTYRHRNLFLTCMTCLILLAGCGGLPKNYVVLLENPDGTTGAVSLSNPSGTQVLHQPNSATGMDSEKDPPGKPFTMESQKIQDVFGKALWATPEAPISFTLYFELDKTELTPTSKKEIPKIISAISGRKAPNISIIGHSDRAGVEKYNYQLALRRAEAIRNILSKEGIDPHTVELTSHGETNPLVETADGVREPRNRRVQVIVR